jgi:hypothetical protein
MVKMVLQELVHHVQADFTYLVDLVPQTVKEVVMVVIGDKMVEKQQEMQPEDVEVLLLQVLPIEFMDM